MKVDPKVNKELQFGNDDKKDVVVAITHAKVEQGEPSTRIRK